MMQEFRQMAATISGVFTQDEEWMRLAIDAALKAAENGEVPVGAVLVDANGAMLSTASNLTVSNNDPTAHAEILAIREAAMKIGNYRLTGTTMYSTIEPCAMCAGALINARISRLVFGAHDERFGAVETHFGIGMVDFLNHQIEVVGRVLVDQCRELMQDFFRKRRQAAKSRNT